MFPLTKQTNHNQSKTNMKSNTTTTTTTIKSTIMAFISATQTKALVAEAMSEVKLPKGLKAPVIQVPAHAAASAEAIQSADMDAFSGICIASSGAEVLARAVAIWASSGLSKTECQERGKILMEAAKIDRHASLSAALAQHFKVDEAKAKAGKASAAKRKMAKGAESPEQKLVRYSAALTHKGKKAQIKLLQGAIALLEAAE